MTVSAAWERIGKEDGPSFGENPVFTSLPHFLDGVAQALSDGVFQGPP